MWLVVFLSSIVLLLVLGTRLSVRTTGQLLAKGIETRHRPADHIVATHTVPDAWLRGRSPVTGREDLLRRVLSPRRQRQIIRRIDRLVRYFRSSPYVADDEARNLLLKELTSVRTLWRAGDGQAAPASVVSERVRRV